MTRWLRRIMLAGAALAVLGSVGLWALVAWWVPVRGKALLIRTVERRWPVSVSIGRMRYAPFHGFLLDEVQVTERATQTVWGRASSARLQVSWPRLALTRQVVFRGEAALEAPVGTDLDVAGRYNLRDAAADLSAETADLAIASLTDPLRRYLPPALVAGTARLELRFAHSPGMPATLTGSVRGTGLRWTAATWQAVGDLLMDGVAFPPRVPDAPWRIRAQATVQDVTVEGLPVVGRVTQLGGTVWLSDERLEIETLTGTALGSPWRLEGVVALRPLAIEARVGSQLPLSVLRELAPAALPGWQADGRADVEAVCRGPLAPAPLMDCLARATVREATLTGPRLAAPLTDLRGRLAYDLLAQRLTIHELTARVQDETVAVAGRLDLAQPAQLHLHAAGTLPMAALLPWLPTDSPIEDVDGAAVVELDLDGAATAPLVTGTVALRNARLGLRAPGPVIEELSGLLTLTPQTLHVADATLRLGDVPLMVAVAVTPSPLAPGFTPAQPIQLTTTVSSPHGRLRLAGRLSPQELAIDEADVSLAASRLTIAGNLARHPEQSSSLAVSGVVELAELVRLPFGPLPQLAAWQLEGRAEVEGHWQGRLTDWKGAALHGSLRADRVHVRHLPLERLTVAIEQRNRVLRVQVPAGTLAGGTLIGELWLEHRPAAEGIVLQANLTGVQLASVAQAVEAWKARAVQGQASAAAAGSGTWKDPRSWRGEGWLTASGQRLGDVPLLDRVLRGLFGSLADRMGLDPLRRAEITSVSLRWRLADERFRTEDLRVGGVAAHEPIAIYATGSVGLDGSLDVVIEPEFSEALLLASPATSTLSSTVLQTAGRLDRFRRLLGRHRLTGTLKEPDYRFELSLQELLRQFAPTPTDLLHRVLEGVR
jgi:hypothetical protein